MSRRSEKKRRRREEAEARRAQVATEAAPGFKGAIATDSTGWFVGRPMPFDLPPHLSPEDLDMEVGADGITRARIAPGPLTVPAFLEETTP